MLWRGGFGLLALACLSGCLVEVPTLGSRDAGLARDAGGAIDAGVGVDAGAPSDGGSAADAGVAIDGGSTVDAGAAGDAGAVADGGVADAGSDSDAGASVDGGLVDGGAELDAGVAADAGAADAGVSPDAGLSHLIGTVTEDDWDIHLAGATVTVIEPAGVAPLVTDATGAYGFYIPTGTTTFVRATSPERMPMLRGIVARPNQRPRDLHLTLWAELDGLAQLLGQTSFDRNTSLLMVDFRNHGGRAYCADLRNEAGATAAFAYSVYWGDNGPTTSMSNCIPEGGGDSVITFVNLPAGRITLEHTLGTQRNPCAVCDANPTRVETGVNTWFDFDCGTHANPQDTCQ